MHPSCSRRAFLGTAALAVAASGLAPVARAIEPFRRSGPPRLKLSLAAYSFRQYFKDSAHPRENPEIKDTSLDLFKFVDFCAAHGCQGAELTSYYFPKDPTAEFLTQVRRHAFLRGVDVSGTAVGNTFTLPAGAARNAELALVKRWIDNAALLGAPHIRVFAGSLPKGVDAAEGRRLCLEALEAAADYAGTRGVMLGIENHGGIVSTADQLLSLVKDVRSPWVGINLDTGNFHTADPYADFARCAPYAVNVQAKGEVRPSGAKASQPADLARVMKILRAAGYQGYVALEYESAEDPHTAVPRLLNQLRPLMAA